MRAAEWLKRFEEASNERRLTGSNEAAMILRNLQKEIYSQTMDIVNKGSYMAEDGSIVTLPDWKEMAENSVLYSEPIILDTRAFPLYNTEVKVENTDCLIAANNLKLQGLNPIVLNMASSKNPGGGVMGGAGAQEENLFRRSNLFKSMYQFAQYAEEYGLKRSVKQYPLDKNYGGVYTPNAVVFRGTQATGYPLFKQPHVLSFVAVAALSHPKLIKGRLAPEEVIITKNKIRTIFRIALKHGHDSMVLGAFGCGAFCNPPAHIAVLFHEVMDEKEFKNHFQVITFAIIEDHNSRKGHNPEGNFVPFQREFHNHKNDNKQEDSLKNMEFKKIKVTAVNLDIKKSITITADMNAISKCPTESAVKKALENQILESKVFQKEDLPKLKYQGRKDVLDEWKVIRPAVAEQAAKEFEVLNNIGQRVTPDNITKLGASEVFVFGSNARGLHGGGAARYAMEHFGAVMGEGHGLHGKSYAIDSMSGLAILAEEVKTFADFAKANPRKTFLVTAIGCGIAGYHESEIAPLFECCRNICNITLPASFWDIIGAPSCNDYDLDRFLVAQERDYPYALEEIRNGMKQGHWIWYIFPQQKGLGHSYNSEYYGLDGLEEAKAYLQHPVLGKRLREICEALLDNKGKDIRFIMGSSIDVIKLKTSMELFDLASPHDIFNKVLRTFF